MTNHLRSLIRDVPDFPSPGILFKDITPLLNDSAGFRYAVSKMIEPFAGSGITVVAGIESRGFIFGAAMASVMDCRFIPVRKPGKLPWKKERIEYDLEYGSDALEIHADALRPGDRLLIVDDVLATGGTLAAAISLAQATRASILGASLLLELEFLRAREKLSDLEIHTVLRY
jgi:adenine phosphoribosyltransferase